MLVGQLGNPGTDEPCPTASLAGFYEPTERQVATLFARGNNGRLNPSLRDSSLVQWGDAVATLASAAVFRLLEFGAATATPGFGGLGNPDVAIAIADLSVSGSGNLADFRRVATSGDRVDIRALRRRVVDAVPAAADRLGATLVAGQAHQIPVAVDHVVDRALRVVWALHGPATHRAQARPALGWIAVNAERDPPPRPVNVPATDWAQSDLQVRVLHAGRVVETRIRYAVAGGVEVATTVSVLDDLPDTRPPAIPPDTLVLVFLHGHSSRLEEAYHLQEALREQHEWSCFRHPYAMVSFDFPTNGYSEYIDHEVLSPIDSTTRFSPDRPQERRFGLLEYYERFVVRFVETLHERMVAVGHLGILDRIAAVVGGSMGGNLALRLSERLVTSAPWLDATVAWSPASVYVSFGRADYFIPSPGEHFDPIAKEALERPNQRCREPELTDTRANFIGLQMQGERLINDGTSEFEVGVRVLSVLLQPLVGGLAPVILGPALGPLVSGLLGPVVFGSFTIEVGFANMITVKQSDEWLRESCRAAYDGAAAARGALLHLHEVYNSQRRRMHWRIAYEQLLFSHQDEVAASRGMPCCEASVVPTLLMAGENDVVDEQRFNIFGGTRTIAPLMTQNPGRAIFLRNTGHSIHAERPRYLAGQIDSFICDRRPPRDVIAVHRADGRIRALDFGGLWKPISVERAIAESRDRGGATPYYVVATNAAPKQIIARRYLTTRPDEHLDNNLRSLPHTTLPRRPGPVADEPVGGFQVTHIRIGMGESPGQPNLTWVSHLCNDELGYEVSVSIAKEAVEFGHARYFIRTEAGDNDLILVQYLTTTPDDSPENNLSSLPDA